MVAKISDLVAAIDAMDYPSIDGRFIAVRFRVPLLYIDVSLT